MSAQVGPGEAPSPACALRATSARVQRGRIRPRTGVGRCAPSAGGRSRAPSRGRAAFPRRRPSRAPAAPRDRRRRWRARPCRWRDRPAPCPASPRRRRGASLGERTSRTISSPRPSGTVQRAAARRRTRQPGHLDVGRTQRLRRHLERRPQRRLRHVRRRRRPARSGASTPALPPREPATVIDTRPSPSVPEPAHLSLPSQGDTAPSAALSVRGRRCLNARALNEVTCR